MGAAQTAFGAKKSLGQHFLHDKNVAAKIVGLLDPREGDWILEIGPGRGALTHWIAFSRPGVFLALEKDCDLALDVKRRWPGTFVVACDALRFPWERLEGQAPWKLVGNLPYNIASPLMWELFSRGRGWAAAAFMVQKEVGQRLVARPGTKAYGALTVWVNSFVTVEESFRVGPHLFHPAPKVDSSVLLFKPRQGRRESQFDASALAYVLRRCFQNRRKQLAGIVEKSMRHEVEAFLEAEGLDPRSRPEVLSPEQFQRLSSLGKRCFAA